MPGVQLGAPGRSQAQHLADYLANEEIISVQTSPLERAQETAEPIATRIGQPKQICEAISEIDFGHWSGMSFSALSSDPNWHAWNNARGVNRPPNGETMLEVQVRIISAMEELRRIYSNKTVVIVSHGDVIKAALLYYLGCPVDAYDRFDIDPASISTVAVGSWGSKILCMNEVVPA
jgi:probable phosphoglycerate mutase